MIPREDIAVNVGMDSAQDLIKDFPIHHLNQGAPILRLLRKPNFQRETNHRTPEQVVTFIESFLDNEVVPSLIFWKSPHYIFVIDGGHRISALRAYMEDDYGDKHISRSFYIKDIPKKQLEIAEKTRQLVKKRIGTYQDLKNAVDVPNTPEKTRKRSQTLFTRGLHLQWIGPTTDAKAAETSFYKINSQGTPLDDVGTLLIKHRNGPISIAARAIVRAGSGHKYWSVFDPEKTQLIEKITGELYEDVFKPEVAEPAKPWNCQLVGQFLQWTLPTCQYH